jgi:hypothetical protein
MLEAHERNTFLKFYHYRYRPYVGLMTDVCFLSLYE